MSVISLGRSSINISGKITDESGNPLPGASIYDPVNTIAGTSSGMDGRFSLNAGSMSSIKISYMGFESKIFRAGSVPKTIRLIPSDNRLNEIVLTARKQKPKVLNNIFKSNGFKLGLAALFLGGLLLGKPKKNTNGLKGLNGYAKVAL
jgi:hypothetical protein